MSVGQRMGSRPDRAPEEDVVGLIPAAGEGSRVAPLPCSKEIFPVGFRTGDDGTPRPAPAITHLLEKMGRAGARRGVVILRQGKWDIPAHLGHGRELGLDLAYVVMRRPFGVPFSVDDARAFVSDATVLFGFPDILSRPDDMFRRLIECLRSTGAAVALAVYPRTSPGADGITLGGEREIRTWDPAPEGPHEHTWIAAAWGPDFTRYLARFVSNGDPDSRADEEGWKGREMAMGDVIRSAMEAGLRVEPVVFEDGRYVDIGTPEDLVAAVREYVGEE